MQAVPRQPRVAWRLRYHRRGPQLGEEGEEPGNDVLLATTSRWPRHSAVAVFRWRCRPDALRSHRLLKHNHSSTSTIKVLRRAPSIMNRPELDLIPSNLPRLSAFVPSPASKTKKHTNIVHVHEHGNLRRHDSLQVSFPSHSSSKSLPPFPELCSGKCKSRRRLSTLQPKLQ